MLSYLKKLKLKLQFTGWLQYIGPSVVSLFLLLFAAFFWLLALPTLMYLFLSLGFIVLTITVFDILTIKYNIRPKERLPKRNDGMNAFDLMRGRVSCRSFQNRKLTDADYKELMDVVQHVTDPSHPNIGQNAIRFEYINARLTVWPVVGAQEFLVAIAPKTYSRESVIDVGRNLQKVVHHATKMGLATCWIGPGADQSSILKHLGDRFNPAEDHIICVCAIGYTSWFKPVMLRVAALAQHTRLPISALFFTDAQLQQPLNINDDTFARFDRCFEVCQWGPSSFNGQTTRCVADFNSELKKFDFYTSTSSRFYAPVALGIWAANWEIGCEYLGIKGHFKLFDKSEMAAKVKSELPVYGVSWVLED